MEATYENNWNCGTYGLEDLSPNLVGLDQNSGTSYCVHCRTFRFVTFISIGIGNEPGFFGDDPNNLTEEAMQKFCGYVERELRKHFPNVDEVVFDERSQRDKWKYSSDDAYAEIDDKDIYNIIQYAYERACSY